jgi:hypothetical protein
MITAKIKNMSPSEIYDAYKYFESINDKSKSEFLIYCLVAIRHGSLSDDQKEVAISYIPSSVTS